MSRFKLALVQMAVMPGRLDANLRHAEELIARAAGEGAQVVLLPEVMDLGWTDPSAAEQAGPIPDGAACGRLGAAARRHGVYVCAGLTERDGQSVYNAAVLLDPTGAPLLHHRKLNELTIGHGAYAQGDRLGVARTPLANFGLMICADGFARDRCITQALGYTGADVVLSPSAWAVPPDHDNAADPYGATWRNAYIPPARDFRMWITGCSSVGPIAGGAWAGWNCIGCSMVVDPSGQVVAQGPYGPTAETILTVPIEPQPRPARGCGWADLWASR